VHATVGVTFSLAAGNLFPLGSCGTVGQPETPCVSLLLLLLIAARCVRISQWTIGARISNLNEGISGFLMRRNIIEQWYLIGKYYKDNIRRRMDVILE